MVDVVLVNRLFVFFFVIMLFKNYFCILFITPHISLVCMHVCSITCICLFQFVFSFFVAVFHIICYSGRYKLHCTMYMCTVQPAAYLSTRRRSLAVSWRFCRLENSLAVFIGRSWQTYYSSTCIVHQCCPVTNLSSFYQILVKLGQNVRESCGYNLSICLIKWT